MSKKLKVYSFDDVEWVIAYSKEDAIGLVNEYLGLDILNYYDESDIKEEPEDKMFTFCDDSDTMQEGEGIEKTLGEWIKIEGRCYFATSEF
jgi:hypothetical protein